MKKFYSMMLAFMFMAMPSVADEVNSYGITGDFNGWGEDVVFTHEGNNVYTLHLDQLYGEIYIKQNGGWDVTLSYKETELEAGYVYDLEWKDASMKLDQRYVDVTLTLTVGSVPTLKFEGTAQPLAEHTYSLIGDFNGWNGDLDFIKTKEGVYVLEMEELQGEIYLRQDHNWAVTLACDDALTAGQTYNLEWKDASMKMAERYVNVTFTLTIGDVPTLKVEGTPASENTKQYALNGAFNNWSLTDGPFFAEQEDGTWVVEVTDFTSDDFVISINKSWTCLRPVNEGVYTPVVVGETYDCVVTDANQNFQMNDKFTGKMILTITDDTHATLKLEGNVTTGINEIPLELKKTIYNLSGQRLDSPQKGINIINGKKYVIK